MSETTDHTIADRNAAVGEGREAAPSPQPPTPSNTGGSLTPTPSDTGGNLTLTMSDIKSAPAEIPGLDGNSRQNQPQLSPLVPGSSAGIGESGEKRTAKSEERAAKSEERPANSEARPVKLCLHVMGDGVFCQIAALSGRPYCYRHLRLRGQQMRMARAIAQRQPYQVCCLRWTTCRRCRRHWPMWPRHCRRGCWSATAPACCSTPCSRPPAIYASSRGPRPKPSRLVPHPCRLRWATGWDLASRSAWCRNIPGSRSSLDCLRDWT